MFRSNLPTMRLFAVAAWLLAPDLLVGAPSQATAATAVKRFVDGNNVRFACERPLTPRLVFRWHDTVPCEFRDAGGQLRSAINPYRDADLHQSITRESRIRVGGRHCCSECFQFNNCD